MPQNSYKFPLTQTKEKREYPIYTDGAGFFKYHPAFSFKYYRENTKEYTFDQFLNKEEFIRFFEELKKMSQHLWEDISIKLSKKYHFHPITWEKTAHPHGLNSPFSLSASINNKEYQFKTFGECRVVGYFNEKLIFEIVWIDRNHKMYPHK